MFLSESDINILCEVLDEYTKQASESIVVPEEFEDYEFSARFEKRMNRLIKRQKKSYYPLINTVGKRVACYVLVVLVCAIVTVFSVKAWRKPFINFVVRSYEKFTSIFVDREAVARTTADVEFEIRLPQYIPEGYELIEKYICDNTVFLKYKNQNGIFITYKQRLFDLWQLHINTESIEYEKINIASYEGVFYKNQEINTLIFENGDFSYSIEGDVSKEELFKIALSVYE